MIPVYSADREHPFFCFNTIVMAFEQIGLFHHNLKHGLQSGFKNCVKDN